MLKPHRERQVLIVLTLMGFTNIVDFMIMMPLSTQLMRVFGISTTQFGVLVSAYAFAAAGASLLMASIADRFDRKRTLIFVYVGLIVGTAGCGFAPNYAMLLIARTVAGAFGGVLSSVALSIIGDIIPDERRGSAMGMYMLSFSLAAVFGVPLSVYVAAHGGWHIPFLTLSVICTVLLFVAMRLLPQLTSHIRKGQPISLIAGYVEILRVPNHWWAFMTSAFIMLSGMMVIPYIAPTRIHNVGLPEVSLGWFYFIGGAMTIVTRPYFGRLSDKYRRANVFYWLVLLSMIPIIWCTHSVGKSLLAQIGVSALFFIFVSGRFIPVTALVTAATLPQMRGRLMSMNAAIQNFATGIAAVIGGAMLTVQPSGYIDGYIEVGYLACLMGLAAVWAAYKVRAAS